MKVSKQNSKLDKTLGEVMVRLKELNGPARPEVYKNFLAQTYFFVSHSVPLLEEAVQHSSNQEFIARSLEHIKEEQGHEKIVLKDLELMGGDISTFSEWQWTKSFYGKQYELIKEDGEILLGYILALEGIAAKGRQLAAELKESYGGKKTKFVKVHVEEDQDHWEMALEQIMKSEVKERILQNFYDTIENYKAFITLLDESDCVKSAA